MPSAASAAANPAAPSSSPPEQLRHPAVDAALSTAATLLGMELVFIGSFADERFRFERIRGDWEGISEGQARAILVQRRVRRE